MVLRESGAIYMSLFKLTSNVLDRQLMDFTLVAGDIAIDFRPGLGGRYSLRVSYRFRSGNLKNPTHLDNLSERSERCLR